MSGCSGSAGRSYKIDIQQDVQQQQNLGGDHIEPVGLFDLVVLHQFHRIGGCGDHAEDEEQGDPVQGIHEGEGGGFGQGRIDDVLVTDHGKEGSHTESETGVHPIGVDVKADIGDQESDVHAQEHFPEQAAGFPFYSKYYPERTVFHMRFGERFIAERGFVGLGGYGQAATVDRPPAQGEPGIEMIAEGIGHEYQGAGIVLRILEVDPQPLAVEGKVADLPGIFHLALKLHHDINHSVGRVDR